RVARGDLRRHPADADGLDGAGPHGAFAVPDGDPVDPRPQVFQQLRVTLGHHVDIAHRDLALLPSPGDGGHDRAGDHAHAPAVHGVHRGGDVLPRGLRGLRLVNMQELGLDIPADVPAGLDVVELPEVEVSLDVPADC